MADTNTKDICEDCGKPLYAYWGWDNTPLCKDHFYQATVRYAAAEDWGQQAKVLQNNRD